MRVVLPSIDSRTGGSSEMSCDLSCDTLIMSHVLYYYAGNKGPWWSFHGQGVNIKDKTITTVN